MKCERQHVVKFGSLSEWWVFHEIFSNACLNLSKKNMFKICWHSKEKQRSCLWKRLRLQEIDGIKFYYQWFISENCRVFKKMCLLMGRWTQRRFPSGTKKTSPHCVEQSVNNVRLICCLNSDIQCLTKLYSIYKYYFVFIINKYEQKHFE